MTSSCLEGASPEETGATDSVDEQARLARKERKRARKIARKEAAAGNPTEDDAPGMLRQ